MSNLKKALYVLLYDQFNSTDLESDDSDETYIDYIIAALIEKNERVCPFKNYDCIGDCKVNQISCTEALNIDCNRETEDIWKDFIDIDAKDDEEVYEFADYLIENTSEAFEHQDRNSLITVLKNYLESGCNKRK